MTQWGVKEETGPQGGMSYGASWSTLDRNTSRLKFSLGQRTKHRTESLAPWGYSHGHLKKRWKRHLWAGDAPQPAHLKQAQVGAKKAISSTAPCCSNRFPNLLQQAENTVWGGSLGEAWKRWQYQSVYAGRTTSSFYGFPPPPSAKKGSAYLLSNVLWKKYCGWLLVGGT